jgi:hypothetical protein
MIINIMEFVIIFIFGRSSGRIRKFFEAGWKAMAVAVWEVIFPFALGGADTRFFPHLSVWMDIFPGATLWATSVGIIARVLKDPGKVQSSARPYRPQLLVESGLCPRDNFYRRPMAWWAVAAGRVPRREVWVIQDKRNRGGWGTAPMGVRQQGICAEIPLRAIQMELSRKQLYFKSSREMTSFMIWLVPS